MILITLVTKLLWMLLSTATETVVTNVVYDRIVRAGHLTSAVATPVTAVVVKFAHDHSILCGLSFPPKDRNLCITVAVSSLGTNFEHNSSSQRCSWSSPCLRSNQILLKMCYLCRQQQPPCGETATPSRTQSTYHNLLEEGCGAGGHCCRPWRSQKVCLPFPVLLLI